MTADELKLRTKQFALRVIRLVGALPKTIEVRAIANQLVAAALPLQRIIVLLVALSLELNSLPKWV